MANPRAKTKARRPVATAEQRMPRPFIDRLLDTDYGDGIAYFREYTGRRPKNDWNGKAVVGPPARPFAELQYAARLQKEGWLAGWCHRAGHFISSWEPVKTEVEFPAAARELIAAIAAKAGGRAGCWDVFAWKDDKPRFVELKRRGSPDRVRKSQLAWKKAALELKVDPSAFQVIEWLGGSLHDYALVATSYDVPRTEAWIRYQRGRVEFGGRDPAQAEYWLKHYRRLTGLKGADLLWVLFRQESGGMVTSWNLRQTRRVPRAKTPRRKGVRR